MPSTFRIRWFLCSVILAGLSLLPMNVLAATRVLVVMSYDQSYRWTVDIRTGIEQTLGPEVELSYFYLNTKQQPEQGAARAAEAYQTYLALQPDGVIAADDHAQSLFVVPYLKDRVATPVIFCGVNADPARYGYPARNVSGVLERSHFEETIAFNRQFFPQLNSFVVMAKDGISADMSEQQLAKELSASKLSAELVAFLRPSSRQEALQMVREYREKADLLIVETLQGVTDETGRPMTDALVLPEIFREFGKSSATNVSYVTKLGALASVVKTGQEQGQKAAQMLRLALQGVPVSELAMTSNYRGRRVVNVTALQQLGITPPALALRGVELVRSE